MIKIVMIYDWADGTMDNPAFTKYNEKMMGLFRQLKDEGVLLELKGFRNITGNPSNVTETTWKSLEDWGKFWESSKYQRILKLGDPFYKNMQVLLLQETMNLI